MIRMRVWRVWMVWRQRYWSAERHCMAAVL
jgi:hypothetical protein